MSSKMILLRSSDGEMIEVEAEVAIQSETIKPMIEDGCGVDVPIPLLNVTSRILKEVIAYCKHHTKPNASGGCPTSFNDAASFDAELAKDLKTDQERLFSIMMAANYLNIKSLLDLTCQTTADMIKGKTPEEIRTTFHIKNDLTAEEEAEIRQENAWAFE